MPSGLSAIIEIAKLWQTWAVAGAAAIVVPGVFQALKWMRRQHCRTLVLVRAVAVHMIQARPTTDDAQRLQENLAWWENEVIKILPKAGATPGEIGDFEALGTVYHTTVVAEKIARLSVIIDRIEGRS